MFDLGWITDPGAAIWKAIEFEIAYYESLLMRNPDRRAFFQGRIKTSGAKLDKAQALASAA